MTDGFTPGPWRAVLDETYHVTGPDGGRVAICTNLRGVHGMGGRRDGKEIASNVRLIAAAPDLLAAAIHAAALLAGQGWRDDGISPEAEALRDLRAAIATAIETGD